MKRQALIFSLLSLALIVTTAVKVSKTTTADYEVGQAIDSLTGVKVYYNGAISHVAGRHTAADGYNLGLRYQCVEFVKRYYYEHYDHRMPDAWGHAKDFFSPSVADGKVNTRRNLVQLSNPSSHKPQVGDLMVFDGTEWNRYGHVAIISQVSDSEVEIIQQNPGPRAPSRETLKLFREQGQWTIDSGTLLGRLRMSS